ncbi:MAG: hypothetical protein AAGA48_17615 [Myxococcota bacterium]
MIRWTLAWPLLIVGACSNFENLEDACKDDVPGARDAPAGAVAVFQRLTCYRRYAGLSEARLSPAISEAVVNHVNYLQLNISAEELFTKPIDLQFEERSRPGYTGPYPLERFDLAGFDTETSSVQTWSVFAGMAEDAPPAQFVDREIHDPLFRDPMLAPGWRAGSFARGELDSEVEGAAGYPFGYLEAALFLPSGQNAFQPVVWPVDGEVDVPTSWFNRWPAKQASPQPFDELARVVGYPVSFTFGSDETSFNFASNPLDVQMRSSRFTGPDGDVLHVALFPGSYFGGVNTSTLALIPVEPLQPGTTYEVEVDVSWVSRDRLTMTTSFTTAGEPTTAGSEFF